MGLSFCPGTPTSQGVPKDFSSRNRTSWLDADHSAEQSPTIARQNLFSDAQTPDSDWDVDFGNSVARVLGASKKL
jgi:hypothetical protein